MTFTLRIDGPRWRAQIDEVAAATPGLVPVVKGNGYGLGAARLGEEVTRLGLDTVAVGTSLEVPQLRETYEGHVLVLTPWHPATGPWPADGDDALIQTVSSVEALVALAEASRTHPRRVVIEVASSMRRHGIEHDRLGEVSALLGGVVVEGYAVHLPLARPVLGRAEETEAVIARLWGAGLSVDRLWVSHLADAELESVRAAHPTIQVSPRVGTRLWLGDRSTLQASGTVLDVHPLRRGERFGYRQRRAPSGSQLVVVGGGTAHGVGLEAPKPVSGMVARGKVAALGGLEAAGRVLSPFSLGGKQRWFAEPPHMQCSMLLVPDDIEVAVGDEVPCEVRFTTSTFDEIDVSATGWPAEE